MSRPSFLTLVVPHAETESLFLRYVVQAAIHAYRADSIEKHNVTAAGLEEDQTAEILRPAI